METCQICGRNVKVDKWGRVSHHGYKHPGTGWQAIGCFGSREPSYERGRGAIVLYIAWLNRALESVEEDIQVLNASGPIAVVSAVRGSQLATHYSSTDPEYPMIKRKRIALLENRIKSIQYTIERSQKRYDEWVQKI